VTTIVQTVTPSTRRNAELLLLLLAVGITLLAWVSVDLGVRATVPAQLTTVGGGLLGLAVLFHLVLRWRAAYADPILLPIATLLNGLGLLMIHRIDLSKGRYGLDSDAARQLLWTGLSMATAAAVVLIVRDHRLLRRRTFTAMTAGVGLLMLPFVPGLGASVLGSRVWIRIGPMSFQPGEIAKLALAVFFAGYLVHTRDVLSLAGKRVLGFTFPRVRDLGPIMIAWLMSLAVLVLQNDYGFSLLLFGLFLVLLYVATERRSWIAIGMLMISFAGAAAYFAVGHIRERVEIWIDPFAPAALTQSDQLAKGLMGMAAGGLFGTGLGQGRPWLVPFADSDFIFASFGEELGLFGVFVIIALYGVFVERGIRTALGVRDGFGKLLAVGLSFSVALQVFIIVGGVTRVLPLTGLTTPFMSLGGSALLANWTLMALLLRISDQARRPVPDHATEPEPPQLTADTQVVSR